MSAIATPVILKCDGCGVTHDLGPMDLGGKSQAEKWGAAIEPAKAVGWEIQIEATGNRRALCPTCAKQKRDLPDFSGLDAKCSKCGTATPDTSYQRHGEAEYFIRACKHCRHIWFEKTADQSRPWWKRLLRIK